MTLFENVNRSADNPVTSIVALLAAAEAIGKVKEEITDNKTILFTFFQGVSIYFKKALTTKKKQKKQ